MKCSEKKIVSAYHSVLCITMASESKILIRRRKKYLLAIFGQKKINPTNKSHSMIEKHQEHTRHTYSETKQNQFDVLAASLLNKKKYSKIANQSRLLLHKQQSILCESSLNIVRFAFALCASFYCYFILFIFIADVFSSFAIR